MCSAKKVICLPSVEKNCLLRFQTIGPTAPGSFEVLDVLVRNVSSILPSLSRRTNSGESISKCLTWRACYRQYEEFTR